MEGLIRGTRDFQLLYNCSFYNVSEIALEHRANVPLGLFKMAYSTIELLLYLPCLWSIWGEARKSSCYKIMFVMGLMDIVNLTIVGPIGGWFQIRGYVYCSAPVLNFTLASIAVGGFMARISVELVLAANRCLFFVAPDLTERLFPEHRNWVWLWMAPPVLLGFAYALFGKVFTFSSYGQHWMLNPHNGYHDEMEQLHMDWRLTWWSVYNQALIVLLPAIYALFLVTILKRNREITDASVASASTAAGQAQQQQRQALTKSVFLQVALITGVNCVEGYLTVLTSFFYMSWPVGVGKIVLFIHANLCIQVVGLPPLIYLTLNKTIRADCRRLLQRTLSAIRAIWSWKKKQPSSMTTTTTTTTKVTSIAAPQKQQQQSSERGGRRTGGGKGEGRGMVVPMVSFAITSTAAATGKMENDVDGSSSRFPQNPKANTNNGVEISRTSRLLRNI